MSFLQHFGNVLKNILHIGEEVAVIAEPAIAAAFPAIFPIYSSALGLALATQASAPTLTGTGPQKLAQLVSNLTPQLEAWAKQNGIVWDNASMTKWASAVVDTINLIPAPTVTPIVPPVV